MSSKTVVRLAAVGGAERRPPRPMAARGLTTARRAFETVRLRGQSRQQLDEASTTARVERAAGFLLQQRDGRSGVIALWYGRSEVIASK